MHAADESGLQAQIAQTRQRIGDRAARRLTAVFHRAIKKLAAFAFDQLHDPLLDAHQVKETVVGLADDIDDGVADTDNLIGLHGVFSSNGHRSRIRQALHLGLRATQV